MTLLMLMLINITCYGVGGVEEKKEVSGTAYFVFVRARATLSIVVVVVDVSAAICFMQS